MLPKNENFQISEHQSSININKSVFLWNFNQFLYIKYQLFKL